MSSLTIHIGHQKTASNYIRRIISKVDGVYCDHKLPTLLANEQEDKDQTGEQALPGRVLGLRHPDNHQAMDMD